MTVLGSRFGRSQEWLVELSRPNGPKPVALGMLEDEFPGGAREVDVPVRFPGISAYFYPFPDDIRQVYSQVAAGLRGYSNGHLLTKFGKKVGIIEAKEFAVSISKELEGIDHEIWMVNKAEVDSWDIKVARAMCNPLKVAARGILNSPEFYPQQPVIQKSVDLPVLRNFNPYEKLKMKSTANVGFWRLCHWGTRRDSSKPNSLHTEIWKDVREKVRSISALPIEQEVEIGSTLCPIATHARAQGGGRIVYNYAKEDVIPLMRIFQRMQTVLDLCRVPWMLGGDRAREAFQMRQVLNGKEKLPLVKGDDWSVKVGDKVVNGDISSHDGSVSCKENINFELLVQDAVPVEEFNVYLRLIRGYNHVDKATGLGMLYTFPGWGTGSGRPDTTILNTVTVVNRIINSLADHYLDFLNNMRKWCFLRKEKQLSFDHTITLCQLIVSKNYPGKIFGLIVRAIRALVEREDRSITTDVNPFYMGDVRIIYIMHNVYGSPLWRAVMDWISDNWELRTSRKVLTKLVLGFMQATRKTGQHERKALSETINYLL